MFCEYKDIFGEPGKGAHSYRVAGLAIVDVIGMLLINWLIVYAYDLNFLNSLVGLSIVTIFIHYLFCVPTAFNKAIGVA
jgi:hypothetical protein